LSTRWCSATIRKSRLQIFRFRYRLMEILVVLVLQLHHLVLQVRATWRKWRSNAYCRHLKKPDTISPGLLSTLALRAARWATGFISTDWTKRSHGTRLTCVANCTARLAVKTIMGL